MKVIAMMLAGMVFLAAMVCLFPLAMMIVYIWSWAMVALYLVLAPQMRRRNRRGPRLRRYLVVHHREWGLRC